MPLVDVIIAGGGPVGTTLALLSAARGIRTQVIHRNAEAPLASGAAAALPYRPIALSHASAQLLAGLQGLRTGDVTAIERIHVSQQGRFGRTVMEARDHSLPALGYVVEASQLARTLTSTAGPLSVRGDVTAWQADEQDVTVEWNDETGAVQTSSARLLVLADGGDVAESRRAELAPAANDASPRASGSPAARSPRSTATLHDYGQQAIVCSVHSSVPHRGVAYERFTQDGPLALLPHGDRYAVVWSLPTARAKERLAASDDAFVQALQETFGSRQGRLSHPGMRLAYPLFLRRSESMRQRVISIGNAAQTLHPVAGQGLNLGLRDAMALADQLAAQPDTIGDDGFIRGYYRQRLTDRAATIAVTDVLARAFTVDIPPAPLVRSLALAALDAFSPARNFFARRMILGARGH